MAVGGEARARGLLEAGRYKEAAEAFIASGELASAARAFVAAKDFFRAAVCYEKAQKPLDAARLYLQIRRWSKAAELYAAGGDAQRAEMALEQLRKEQAGIGSPQGPAAAWAYDPLAAAAAVAPPATPDPPPPAPTAVSAWPAGEFWQSLSAGDVDAAVKRYLSGGARSGWELLGEAKSPEALQALAEVLFQAKDHAVAAEAFMKAGDVPRSAQCLSLAGLNEEAAHYFYNLGEKLLAAQHLEKAQAWDQAAGLYVQEHLYLDAARCHERGDEPVKAAAMYLKARKLDLALPLLQAVAPTHRSFAACRLLAGKILFQKGQQAFALAMLAPLLESPPQTEEGLETVYQAAALMEQGGEPERARDAYRFLQESRFGFKDVAERLQRLSEAPVQPAQAHSPSVRAATAGPAPGAAAPVAPAAPAVPAAAPANRSGQPFAQPAAPAAQPMQAPPPAVVTAPELSPLRDCSLFNRLSTEEMRRVWSAGKTGECRPGKIVLKAGEVAPGLMIVLAGGLTITPDPNDPGVAVGFLGAGDYVGLGSLLSGPPQQNALVAQAGTRLLVLTQGALETLFDADPELGMRFFRSAAEHLVQTLKAGTARTPPPRR